jgi:hypothetical protein
VNSVLNVRKPNLGAGLDQTIDNERFGVQVEQKDLPNAYS